MFFREAVLKTTRPGLLRGGQYDLDEARGGQDRLVVLARGWRPAKAAPDRPVRSLSACFGTKP